MGVAQGEGRRRGGDDRLCLSPRPAGSGQGLDFREHTLRQGGRVREPVYAADELDAEVIGAAVQMVEDMERRLAEYSIVAGPQRPMSPGYIRLKSAVEAWKRGSTPR